jgi:uncharacterized protein
LISLKFSVVALFRQNGIDRWRKQKNIDISLDENLDLLHVSSVEFDWNPAKRAKTIADRAVDFAEVLPGFRDPLRKVTVDSRKDYGEVRFNMLAKYTERIFHIPLRCAARSPG